MRYAFLIAAALMLAATSASLAKADRHGHHRHNRPAYGATQLQVVPAARSWLDIEHDLDPCHCSSSF